MVPSLRPLCLASLLCMVPFPARAASFLVGSDEELLRQADLVVRGRVLDAESREIAREGSGATIVTDVRIAVEKILKGSYGESLLTIRQPGGVVGEMMQVFPGTGSLRLGERVLLLLESHAGTPPRLLHFALGKFHIAQTVSGEEMAYRDGLAESLTFRSLSAPRSERPRALDEFERYIQKLETESNPEADYFRDDWTPAHSLTSDFELLDVGGGNFARWQQFDGDATVVYEDDFAGPVGTSCPTGCHLETALGVEDWNAEPGSNIELRYGGTDAAVGSTCLADLRNRINYDDPCNDIANLSGCAGTLALGGFRATNSSTSKGCSAKGSSNYWKILDAQLMVNNGVGNCLSSCQWEEMIAHETGHTLGFGHTSVAGALMAPSLGSGCGNLRSDDVAAAQCVYSDTVITDVIVVEDSPTKVKLKVIGAGFVNGDVVQIDNGSGFQDAPITVRKSSTKLVAKQVASIFPDNSTVSVRVRKSNGGFSNEFPASR